MVIHEAVQASITPADTDILTGPINPSGIASISAPNLLLNTHAHERYRLQSLNPNGIVFEGSQTRYEEMRGAVSEVLRDIGIRDVEDREEMLGSFDRLHEGEEKAVADFQAALGDFKDGTVNPILEELRKAAEFIDKEAPILLSLTGLSIGASMAGYLAVDYLRRRHDHIDKRYPQARKALTHLKDNSFGYKRGLSLIAVFGGLLAGCTGMVVATSTQTAPAPDGSTPASPAPISPDMTSTPASASAVPAPDASHTPEATQKPPPEGYKPSAVLGGILEEPIFADSLNQGFTEAGLAHASFLLGHKFSVDEIRAIISSGIPKYGLSADIAQAKLAEMESVLNHTPVAGDRQVMYVQAVIPGEDPNNPDQTQTIGFMILTSDNGNIFWIAKDAAPGGKLNLQPNVTFGLPEHRYASIWQDSGSIPSRTVISKVDISGVGGIDGLQFVFQREKDGIKYHTFAYMVGASLVKGAYSAVTVFDAKQTDPKLQWIALESSIPVPDPTVTPTLTETSTATPRPTETPSIGTPIFMDAFESNPRVYFFPVKDAGFWNRWNNILSDGTKLEIVPITSIFSNPAVVHDSQGILIGNVLKITITGDPVLHPEWGNPNILWWSGEYYWTYSTNENLKAPAAIQVDLLKSTELGGSFLSVHRLNKITGDTISDAAIEIDDGDRGIKLLARDGNGKDTRVYLRQGLFRSGKWNTIRIEFRPDGTLIPFINGQYAYVDGQKPLKVPVDNQHDSGFMDGRAGYLRGIDKNSNFRVEPGLWLLNRNFIVEGAP